MTSANEMAKALLSRLPTAKLPGAEEKWTSLLERFLQEERENIAEWMFDLSKRTNNDRVNWLELAAMDIRANYHNTKRHQPQDSSR